MKRLKVLALCAVLAGLGGAVSARPSSEYDKYKDDFVEWSKDQLGPMASFFDDDDIWNEADDEAVEAWLAMTGAGGSSGSGSGSVDLQGLKSLSRLKAEHSHVTLVAPASQSGLVSEVDDYMDVNSWQSVQFDKLFTHVGYNINDEFNAGVATRFGDVYTGVFFYGNFIDSTTKISKWKEDGEKEKVTSTSMSSGQVFQLSALIGSGNFGIKPSVLFAPKSGVLLGSGTVVTGSDKYTDDDGTTMVTTNSFYEIYPELRVGFNTEAEGFALRPHAYIGFDFDVNKTTTKYDEKNVSGHSNTWTLLGVGTEVDLPQKDGSVVTNTLSADLDFAFRSKTKTFSGSSTSTAEDGYTQGAFTLGWTGKFVPADNVSFKLAASLPVEWGVERFGTKTEDKYSATDIAPAFTASVKYQATEKLALGLAADLGLPSLEFASMGAGDNKVSSVWFNAEDSLSLQFSAGFRLDFIPGVTLDCGWDFGGNLLSDYLGTVSRRSDTLWDGLSRIFSDIQMGLSVKL